jgi:gamma-glutamyl:cysteine ligase YbdK (ATP-grasp superfamily)
MVMSKFSLFSVVGIEIEYMLVDSSTLEVQPKSDIILEELAGEPTNEASLGDIAVSNELVLHVIELKNNGPKPVTSSIAHSFQQAITDLQPLLQQHHLRLLPSGAHPWMNPLLETKRWPHGNKAIYNQYDSIFNCQGHGWANLQSMHINLPFANDTEFFALHSVVRLLLPLLPALAASTPILSGKPTGLVDSRLSYYAVNQQKIPAISGLLIPEFISSEAEYQEKILQPMYKAISPYDPDKLLQYEWLNSRAAIAKFEYGALEIRIVDSQENVNSDFAIAQFVCAILKSWHEASSYHLENACSVTALKEVYDQAIHYGLQVSVDNSELMQQWQLPKRTKHIRDILALLIERVSSNLSVESQIALENILSQGNLSERISRSLNKDYSKENLKRTYQQLANCLITNQQFFSL